MKPTYITNYSVYIYWTVWIHRRKYWYVDTDQYLCLFCILTSGSTSRRLCQGLLLKRFRDSNAADVIKVVSLSLLGRGDCQYDFFLSSLDRCGSTRIRDTRCRSKDVAVVYVSKHGTGTGLPMPFASPFSHVPQVIATEAMGDKIQK